MAINLNVVCNITRNILYCNLTRINFFKLQAERPFLAGIGQCGKS